MTLNITLITKKFLCQVSDQRLVDTNQKPNKLISNYARKLIKLKILHSKLNITYHGTAELWCKNQFCSINDWLLEFSSKNQFHKKRHWEAVKLITNEISDGMIIYKSKKNTLKESAFRLSLIIAGFNVRSKPFFYLVSNYEEFGKVSKPKPSSTFNYSSSFISKGEKFKLFIGGIKPELAISEIRKELDKILIKHKNPEMAIQDYLVSLIEKSTHETNSISESCLTTIEYPNNKKPYSDYFGKENQLRKEFADLEYQGARIKNRSISRKRLISSKDLIKCWDNRWNKDFYLRKLSELADDFKIGDMLDSNIHFSVTTFLECIKHDMSYKGMNKESLIDSFKIFKNK